MPVLKVTNENILWISAAEGVRLLLMWYGWTKIITQQFCASYSEIGQLEQRDR